MEEITLKRFGLITAIRAEIEGMKIANEERLIYEYSVAYDDSQFFKKSEEIKRILRATEEELNTILSSNYIQ